MDAVQANVLGATAPASGLKTISSPNSSSVSSLPLASAIPPPGVLPPVVLQQAHITTSVTAASNATDTQNPHVTSEELVKQKQEELQKKLMEEGEPTLQQQESMSIKGQSARHLVMQRLMRPRDSKVVILRNMVGPEDVDETLQEEIQDECSKYGLVEKVIIYKEKQTDNDDDDLDDVIVKIFVEFSMSSGKLQFFQFNQLFLTQFSHLFQRQIKQAMHWTGASSRDVSWRPKATIRRSSITTIFPAEQMSTENLISLRLHKIFKETENLKKETFCQSFQLLTWNFNSGRK